MASENDGGMAANLDELPVDTDVQQEQSDSKHHQNEMCDNSNGTTKDLSPNSVESKNDPTSDVPVTDADAPSELVSNKMDEDCVPDEAEVSEKQDHEDPSERSEDCENERNQDSDQEPTGVCSSSNEHEGMVSGEADSGEKPTGPEEEIPDAGESTSDAENHHEEDEHLTSGKHHEEEELLPSGKHHEEEEELLTSGDENSEKEAKEQEKSPPPAETKLVPDEEVDTEETALAATSETGEKTEAKQPAVSDASGDEESSKDVEMRNNSNADGETEVSNSQSGDQSDGSQNKETAKAPLLEQEAPILEQEAPILEAEKPLEEERETPPQDSSTTKITDQSHDTISEADAMEIDPQTTNDLNEKALETSSGPSEMEETSQGETDKQVSDGQSNEKSGDDVVEPPILDPETPLERRKEAAKDDDVLEVSEDDTNATTTEDKGKESEKSAETSSVKEVGTQDEKEDKKTAEKTSPSKKSVDEEDDDVMVIEDDVQEPEAIVLDDDDEDEQTQSNKGDGKDSSSFATMDSSNDTGLQISSVTSGADASSLQIASVSGAVSSKSKEKPNDDVLKTKIKQEKITPPSTPDSGKSTSGTPGKKSNKMQTCIVCHKVGRCKYNIVRNGDIKHLCDDACFRDFRSNPTQFLKNATPSQPKSAPQKANTPSTRSQTGRQQATAAKSKTQPEYKTCTVCQLMNINTQKPFVMWMNLDFCSEACLEKYQGNLNSACSYCTSFVPPNRRPLHCFQVGTAFKTFCSAKCNNEFKKRLRLCAFCQKDLSNTTDSFCAPVEPNKFRDFCSKSCLKRYEEKNADIEIISVESSGKKSSTYSKCAVCSKNLPVKHSVKLNSVLNRLCSDPCLSAFQYANKLNMNKCDSCGSLCPSEDVVSHFIQFEGQQKRFCKDQCVNSFRGKHRKVVACAWCGTKKTNFDMIERVDSNNKYQLFCSLNCLSLYRVNLQAKSNQAVSCDQCRKHVPAQYHLTMSDASVRNFCSYNCVMSFQSQFGASSKNSSQPTIHSQQRVQLQNKPNTRGSTAIPAQQVQNQSNSFPVISNVVSLAPQGQKQQTVNIKSSTPVPVVVNQGGKQTVSTGTQQQIIIQPPPPKQMKNKSLLCKPFMQTKATSCRPHTMSKEIQTDEQEGKPVLIPVPIPIFVPCPMAMYAAPTPQPFPVPIPVPVPVFIPTSKKTSEKILKQIKEICEKIPSDPLEAELLMMAEAVAGAGDGSDSDTDKSDTENIPFPAMPNATIGRGEEDGLIERSVPGNGEEDLVQMALRMAEEITGPVLDLETNVEPVAVNTEPPAPAAAPAEPMKTVSEEDEEYVPPRENRSRRGKRGSRGRATRQSKRARVEIPEPEPVSEPSPPAVSVSQPPPDANMHLKYTYGVNAWRHWVVQKNTLLEKVSRRGSSKLKLFKTDLLQCSADELNYSLCLFVKEVRKPNGGEYSPDSIFYLCLGIQQYLYENGRIDNILMDLYYEKFTECLNDVLAKYEPKVNAAGQMLCRIEEEHIWECKQLGAHSPNVLLNTLIYFNTKHFMLKTADEHMKLSFAHILKHWKKGGPGSAGAKVVTGQGRSVSLRYYCLSPNGQSSQSKKPKDGIPVYETSENLENPLRCPVKLYEFYLSKCPESIKNRNDMFYLVPERSCVPDSPVWYSTQPIPTESMSKMLNRILLVREIQEAHIHAQPIFV